MNTLEKMADFTVKLKYEDLTKTSIEHAKNCFVDTFGVAILGSRQKDSEKLLLSLQKYRKGDYSQAWAKNVSLDPAAAALMNSFAGHVYDFDDNCIAGFAHLSVIIVPALIAIIGWEVSGRMGLALPNFYKDGWHCSSIFGALGAAAAVAKILSLDFEQTKNALALTICQLGGIRECNGTKGKPFTLAKAAESAVTACYTAQAGIACSVNMLEGENGFFQVMAKNMQDSSVFDHLGKPFVLDSHGVMVKKYPICSSAHSAFEAMQKLQEKHNFELNQIDSIHCKTTDTVLKYLIHDRPQDAAQAQFSLPYLLAVAFVDREFEMKKHLDSNYIKDKKFSDCMDKISYSSRAKLITENGEEVEYSECAEVIIKTKDNQTYSLYIGEANGFPSSPFTYAQFKQKFLACTQDIIPEDNALQILDQIYKLETITKNVSSLFKIV